MKTILIICVLFSSVNSFTQSMQQERTVRKNNIDMRMLDEQNNKMQNAKQNGRAEEVLEIQKQTDILTGLTVTKSGEQLEMHELEKTFNASADMPAVNISQISGQSNIKAIGTFTEQAGSTAGRIWTVYGYSNGPADALAVFYSDDNGESWINYTQIGFSGSNRISSDELDIEIVTSSTNKYLWVVYGYIENGTNDWKVGLTVVKVAGGVTFGSYTLSWPGATGSNYYYRPRICSDNAYYIGAPGIYIICDFDSTVSGGYLSGGKVAACSSPLTTSPVISFKGEAYFGLEQYRRPYTYDIAYFRNNSVDSLLIVECGIIDSNFIDLSGTKTNFFLYVSGLAGFVPYNGRVKTHAYVAGNGPYNKLMIVCREKYSANLWDIRYFGSEHGSYGWSTGYVDGRFVNKSRPDITGKQNSPGSFYCAYSTIGTYDSVFYATTTNYNWNTYVGPVNSISSNITSALPRPGFKNTTVDDCFTLWSPGSGVYGSYGCGAITIGIQQNGTNVPLSYELKQNYPNPFNPVTNVEFSIPKQGNVRLTIYDAIGNEVSVLVNKELEAGNYKVDFNASSLASGIYFYKIQAGSFTYVRKMAIVK